MDSTVRDQVPTTLGRYQNLQILGQGGMGKVFRAYDPTLDREVAIKVMADRSPEFVARFQREARAMARLSHPRIAQVYDFGQDEAGNPYFVMELVIGQPLDQLLAQRGQLRPEMVARVLLQAAEGLSAAHAAGIVHRDIKPANLILDQAGDLKVVDFGIARIEEGPNPLTRPQALIGTPHYMAPEVLSGEIVDGRADIYALGLCGYHLLTGQPPFSAPSAVALAMKHLSEPLPDLSALAPDTPSELRRLIGHMAEKRRDARIGSCEEVIRELRAILAGLSTQPARPGALGGRAGRRRLALVGALGGGLIALMAGTLALWRLPRQGTGPGDAGGIQETDGGSADLKGAARAADLGRTPGPLVLPGAPLRVAVLKFKNLGEDRELAFLTEGIAETVVTALGGQPRLRLLERNQVDQAIKEIDFDQTKYVDRDTAVALGRISGAEVAVQGGYQRAAGQIRVTARLVRIETGEVLDTLVVTRPAAKLFDVQDLVAKELKERLLRLLP
jgi:serine/threonine-protein kinase